jgi:hypothetical protein
VEVEVLLKLEIIGISGFFAVARSVWQKAVLGA